MQEKNITVSAGTLEEQIKQIASDLNIGATSVNLDLNSSRLFFVSRVKKELVQALKDNSSIGIEVYYREESHAICIKLIPTTALINNDEYMFVVGVVPLNNKKFVEALISISENKATAEFYSVSEDLSIVSGKTIFTDTSAAIELSKKLNLAGIK